MDFYDRNTLFSHLKQQKLLKKNETIDDFYHDLVQKTIVASRFPDSPENQFFNQFREEFGDELGHGPTSANNELLAEWDWIKLNKPYYKIYPDWIFPFSQTRLDIPSRYFVLPFKSILIRFPKNHGLLKADDDHEVQTLLLHEFDRNESLIVSKSIIPNEKRSVLMWMDIGEVDSYQLPVRSYIQAPFTGDELIEDGLEKLPYSKSIEYGVPVSRDLFVQCLKICVAICFLATGEDRLVQPDVLSKDLLRFHETQNETIRRALQNRAKKRGKNGWTISTREILLGRHRNQENHESFGEKRGQLRFQHQRAAHFHLVRFGPEKKDAKVQLYRQITVRPDLPPPLVDRGYRAKK